MTTDLHSLSVRMSRVVGSLDSLAIIMASSNDPLMLMRAPAVQYMADELTSCVRDISQLAAQNQNPVNTGAN